MPVEIITPDQCVQGSYEWRVLRSGMPTASNFAKVMREGGRAADGSSKERATYLRKVAGEILTGIPAEDYKNDTMARGNAMEEEALAMYAIVSGNDPERITFIKNGKAGYSPDAVVGSDGLVEIKTMAPHRLIEELYDKGPNHLPPEHGPQVHGGMWVSGRRWVDVVFYYTNMPPAIRRVRRDEGMCRTIENAIDVFNLDVRRLVDRIKGMQRG